MQSPDYLVLYVLIFKYQKIKVDQIKQISLQYCFIYSCTFTQHFIEYQISNPFELQPERNEQYQQIPQAEIQEYNQELQEIKQTLTQKQLKKLKQERIQQQQPYTLILSNCPKQCYKHTIQPLIEKYIKPEQNKIQSIYFRAQSYEKINTKLHKIEYLNKDSYTVYEQQLCFVVFENMLTDEQFNQLPNYIIMTYKQNNEENTRFLFVLRKLNEQLTNNTLFIPHFTKELSIQKIFNYLDKIFQKYQNTCKLQSFNYIQSNNCLYIQYSEQLQQTTADRIFSIPIKIQEKQLKIFKCLPPKKAQKAKKVLERRRIAQLKSHKGQKPSRQ